MEFFLLLFHLEEDLGDRYSSPREHGAGDRDFVLTSRLRSGIPCTSEVAGDHMQARRERTSIDKEPSQATTLEFEQKCSTFRNRGSNGHEGRGTESNTHG
jgi:hypothetical protein